MGLLVPMFRVDDEPSIGRRLPLPSEDRSRIAHYAREGQLRDPGSEGHSSYWAFVRPPNAGDWWDGYFYSKWQLLGLRDALGARSMRSWVPLGQLRAQAGRLRQEHAALAALSTRHFPSIVGQVLSQDGNGFESIAESRRAFDDQARLASVLFDPRELQSSAELLLGRAHSGDPLAEWWPAVRHSDHRGCFKLKGLALEAIWQRIAAEMLLRAHESVAEIGLLPPLKPTVGASRFWHPLFDRIGDRGRKSEVEGLEQALSALGLAPQPRVVLVVEGKTEQIHVTALLEDLGLGQSRNVRLVVQSTSSDWPHQLAKFIAPRLGEVRAGRHTLSAPPSALVVAMDPEGPWSSDDKRSTKRKSLQELVKAEVDAQGGEITAAELDTLVQVRTWGQQKYELANFTDSEIEAAMKALAAEQGEPTSHEWELNLRDAIARARIKKYDISTVFDRMRMKAERPRLAELLTPVVRAKLDDAVQVVPVVELVTDVYHLVQRLSGSGYSLETEVKS